jgi:hypothetical protein
MDINKKYWVEVYYPSIIGNGLSVRDRFVDTLREAKEFLTHFNYSSIEAVCVTNQKTRDVVVRTVRNKAGVLVDYYKKTKVKEGDIFNYLTF